MSDILSRVDVRYNAVFSVPLDKCQVTVSASITCGLYDGKPDNKMLIGLLASRGVEEGDIDHAEPWMQYNPSEIPENEELVYQIGDTISKEENYDNIGVRATIEEVIVDDVSRATNIPQFKLANNKRT